MDTCDRLPSLIKFEDYNGEWEAYENALYDVFKTTFIDNTQYFRSKPIGIFTETMYHGKEKTFWHVISEGDDEYNRTPNIRRCERIVWIDTIIKLLTCKSCSSIYKWRYKHSNRKYRYKLWCKETNFIVILEERAKCFMLITAYVVTYNHAITKLEKEYNKAERI